MGFPSMSKIMSLGRSRSCCTWSRAVIRLFPMYSSMSEGSDARPLIDRKSLSSSESWVRFTKDSRPSILLRRFFPRSSLRKNTQLASPSMRMMRLLSRHSSSRCSQLPSPSILTISFSEKLRRRTLTSFSKFSIWCTRIRVTSNDSTIFHHGPDAISSPPRRPLLDPYAAWLHLKITSGVRATWTACIACRRSRLVTGLLSRRSSRSNMWRRSAR
mmetsp:Transcript_25362/g.80675  ORF Transcript_25362/g.80675 Transcript_25362/m.80675 type:complete len:215 (-) Transcript_25362:716-1360(-)